MIWAAVLAVVLLGAAAFSTCIYKRSYRGAFVPFACFVAAFRLARPNSWWARRFYGHTEKMRRAEARYGTRPEGEPDRGWGWACEEPPGCWWPFWSRSA